TGSLFGAMPVHETPTSLAQRRRVTGVQEQPHTILEQAQTIAAAKAAAEGGDKLSQVVAATGINAEMGAHYDAGAYEGHIATRHAQVAEEAAARDALDAEAARTAAFNKAQDQSTGVPSPDDAFAARERQQAQAKDQDFTAARNQKADQDVGQATQEADTLNAGIERGGATEPAPTIADALPEDTVKALRSLQERRAAEAGKPTPDNSPAAVAARIKAGTPPEDSFQPLPPNARGEEPESPASLKQRREQLIADAAKEADARRQARALRNAPRDLTLNDRAAAIEDKFAKRIEADPQKAIEEYENMEGTYGGKYIGADAAARLSPDYLKDPTANTKATGNVGSWLAEHMFQKRMNRKAPEDENRVVLTSGGPGSGKTTAALSALADEPGIHTVYDSVLRDLPSAQAKIEQAKAHGYAVDVLHVARDPVESFENGVLPRANRIGRPVSLNGLASGHAESRGVAKQLAKLYEHDPDVSVRAISPDRPNEEFDPRELPDINQLAVKKRISEVLDREYKAGRVSDKLYRAIAEKEPPERISGAGGAARPEKTDSAANREEAPGVLVGSPTAAEIKEAGRDSAYHPENPAPTPTQAQYEAGNYAKGHVRYKGMDVSIEHPAGSERPLGDGSTRTMPADYGYIRNTEAADGQHVDVLIGRHPESDTHYLVDHLDRSGNYEQTKVLSGFNNRIEAMRAYKKMYPDHPNPPVSEVKTPELKQWLDHGDTARPYDQKAVNRLGDSRVRLSTAEAKPTHPEAVNHATENAGDGKTRHIYTYQGGALHALEDPRAGVTRVELADAGPPTMRGRGIGTALLQRSIADAHARGQRFESDQRVSAPQTGTYASLKQRGYDVHENPSTVDPGTGERVSKSPLKGVYEVKPKADSLASRRFAAANHVTADAERAQPLT
ncbi:MAG: hypothetical protein ACYDAE_27960, partial [Steroidobacteraceae bacterium]